MASNRTNLLILLLLDQSSYQSAIFFANKLGVSKQSIYKDMEIVEFILQKSNFKLEKSPRLGYKISGNEEEILNFKFSMSEKNYVSDTPDFRRLELFAKILFQNTLGTYEELAEEFDVSTITIRKDFEKISKELINKGLVFRKKRDMLCGKEIKVQECFKNLLLDYSKKYQCSDWQYRKIFLDKYVDFIDELIESFENEGNNAEYFIDSLKGSLLILLQRLNMGKHIENSAEPLLDNLDNLRFYQAAIDISGKIQKDLQIHMENADILYLGTLLAAHKFELSNNPAKVSEKDVLEIDQVILSMSELLNNDLSQDVRLKQSLISHIIPMIYRIKLGIRIKNPLKEKIINQYFVMFQFVSIAVEQLEVAKRIQLTEDELSFLTIYFQIAIEKIDIAKHIIVVCPNGMGTSQLVFQRIRQILPRSDIVEIIDVFKLQIIDLSKFDLIISTIKIPKFSIPTIYVSDLPTEKELANISEILYGLKIKSKDFSRSSPQGLSKLRAILDEQFIFIKYVAEDMKDVIDFVSEELLSKKIVKAKFKDSLYSREKQGITSLSSGLRFLMQIQKWF